MAQGLLEIARDIRGAPTSKGFIHAAPVEHSIRVLDSARLCLVHGVFRTSARPFAP